jgi:predicted NAD-dependent protein-ADP-ribosyltransferase YbiA (DUF1768 family)
MASSAESGPVFFWHAEGENGHFGQWYYAPWEHEGVRYETAEMWMMVQKAKLFKDEVSIRSRLLSAITLTGAIEYSSPDGRNHRS